MNILVFQKNARELASFVKKANRKLLEFEVFQSVMDIKNGRAKIFNTADELRKYMESKGR